VFDEATHVRICRDDAREIVRRSVVTGRDRYPAAGGLA